MMTLLVMKINRISNRVACSSQIRVFFYHMLLFSGCGRAFLSLMPEHLRVPTCFMIFVIASTVPINQGKLTLGVFCKCITSYPL